FGRQRVAQQLRAGDAERARFAGVLPVQPRRFVCLGELGETPIGPVLRVFLEPAVELSAGGQQFSAGAKYAAFDRRRLRIQPDERQGGTIQDRSMTSE